MGVSNTATTLLLGQNALADDHEGGEPTTSLIKGRFILSVESVLEIQHRCQINGSEGFGLALGFGTEVYTVAEFWSEK